MKNENIVANILNSAKDIAIIEPHYDDAWLNLGGFILQNPKKRFTILSVCDDLVNDKNETKNLEQFLPNLKTEALRYKGIHYNEQKNLEKAEYKNFFSRLNNLKNFKDFEERLQKETKKYDLIFLPYGYDKKGHHPQHIIISQLNMKNRLYYLEFPYTYKNKKSIKIISAKEKYCIDIRNSLKKKINLFKKVYKSQKKILKLKSTYCQLKDIVNEIIVRK